MDNPERELQETFLQEADQLLSEAEASFLELETAGGDRKPLLERIFRLAHNLKGSAKAVGFQGLSDFTHHFESFLLVVKSGEIPLTASAIDLMLRCADHLKGVVEELRGGNVGAGAHPGLIAELGNPRALAEAPPAGVPAQTMAAPADGFAIFDEPAPVYAPKPVVATKAPEKTAKGDGSIRVSLERVQLLMDYVGELIVFQSMLLEQIGPEGRLAARKTLHQVQRVSNDLQDLAMAMRMLPVRQTFQKMQRIVRDTSAALGKKITLELHGEDTEVDKNVLEHIGDPLVHLVRNACDHGVEGPEARAAAGKPEAGTIRVEAFQESGSLVIVVADDGAGMDADRLRKKAVERGILRAGETMPDADAYQLIFHSGFSTKAEVSDVSGRGVGMDVVKSNIESLQGRIEIETVQGKGSKFLLRLPLSLAICDALIVREAGERFVVPLHHIKRAVPVTAENLHTTSSLGEVLSFQGARIPTHRLRALLRLPAKPAEKRDGGSPVVLLLHGPGGTTVGVVVDDLVSQQQVVIKKLGDEHGNMRGITGSSILGDGKPAFILEIAALVPKDGSKGKAA